MPAIEEWPRAHVTDPPAQLVAAWLMAMHLDGAHTEYREAFDATPPVVAVVHPGYVVKLCHRLMPDRDACGRWYICARGASADHCGAHP